METNANNFCYECNGGNSGWRAAHDTRVVQLYTAWGQPEQAAAWQQKLAAFNQAEAEKKSAAKPK